VSFKQSTKEGEEAAVRTKATVETRRSTKIFAGTTPGKENRPAGKKDCGAQEPLRDRGGGNLKRIR